MASLPSDDPTVDGQPSAEPSVVHQLLAPAALLLGAALIGGAGVVGVIETSGATGATSVPAAVWVVALPGILAAVVTVFRPRLGAAFAAGAGALAVVRLLTDLFVLLEPAQVVRPEFYFPSSTQVHPVGASFFGAALLIVGDLLLVAGGVLGLRAADRGLRGRLAPAEPARDGSGAPESSPDSAFSFGSRPDPVPVEPGSPVASVNVRMVAVGLVGVAIAVVLTVQVPYVGGYLDDFYAIPSDLGSTLGPFLLALVSAGVVIRAAGFPRAMATALLAGAAAMFLVPMLTAVLAVSGGARTALATAPLLLPIGLLAMIGAGLLSAVRWAAPDPHPVTVPDTASAGRAQRTAAPGRSRAAGAGTSAAPKSAGPKSAAGKSAAAKSGAGKSAAGKSGAGKSGAGKSAAAKSHGSERSGPAAAPAGPDTVATAPYAARPSEPIGLIGAGLAALAGAAALLAPTFGMVLINGRTPGSEQKNFLRTGPVVGSGVDSVLAVPAIVAGVSLLVSALVVVLGRLLQRESVTAAARTASVLVVVLQLVAVAGPLSTLAVLSTGQAQAAQALSGNAPAGFEVDVWSAGPGVWSLVAALALGLAAAACSSTALSRRSEELTWGPDDDAADVERRRRWSMAAAVIALALLGTAFPAWALPLGAGSTFFAGDAAWTCWLLVLGAAVGAVLIAVARAAAVVLGAAVGAVILVASRLIVPSGVAEAPGFVRPWGWYLGCLAVLAVLGIGFVTARWVGTFARAATMGSAPHVDNRPKPIRHR